MTDTKISLEGPWPKVWMGWLFVLLAWMGYSPFFVIDPRAESFGLLVIFTVWVFLEYAGGVANARHRKERETARQLSQLFQRVVQEQHVYKGWYRGYPGLVTCMVCLIARAVTIAFAPFDPIIAICMGAGVLAYLLYHLIRRGTYG